MLSGVIDGVRFVALYAPNGRVVGSPFYEGKLRWFERVRRWLDETRQPDEPLVVAGDYNVTPADEDVWDPVKAHGGTHVSEPEREALAQLREWGLAMRTALQDRGGRFSWWDYRAGMFHRNEGMRIDLLLRDRAGRDAGRLGRDRPGGAQGPASAVRPRAGGRGPRHARETVQGGLGRGARQGRGADATEPTEEPGTGAVRGGAPQQGRIGCCGAAMANALCLVEVQPHRDTGRLRPRRDTQLPEDVRHMDAGRALADEQLVGDLPVRPPGRDERQHLPLPWREPERIVGRRRCHHRSGGGLIRRCEVNAGSRGEVLDGPTIGSAPKATVPRCAALSSLLAAARSPSTRSDSARRHRA